MRAASVAGFRGDVSAEPRSPGAAGAAALRTTNADSGSARAERLSARPLVTRSQTSSRIPPTTPSAISSVSGGIAGSSARAYSLIS